MTAHAQLSPSSAARWMTCPGSVALTKDMPDTSSAHADEGTAAHEVAARCLEGPLDASELIGATASKGVTVTDDMAHDVQRYVDYVRDVQRSTGGELLVEQRLPISQITGEEGAHGTADAVILAGDELIVIDLKFGRGVAVEAEGNPQIQIYALAALDEFGLVGDFKTVRMVIHQPRLNSVTEWVQTVDEMAEFAGRVREAAIDTRDASDSAAEGFPVDAYLNPSDKACRWCKAAGTCPALTQRVQTEVGAEFDDLTEDAARKAPEAMDTDRLASAMAAIDLVEIWAKAVRAEVERRLMAGEPVPGWKVVQGKRGARAWSDAEQAEKLLKDTFRLKTEQVYDLKLISPTSAEKLAKAGEIGPRQWPKVEQLIVQPEGKPSVAPESDKRPALVMSAVAADFEDMTETSLV